jgi:H+/Cl- antiporter ClcA
MPSEIKGHQAAGALYLLSALVNYLTLGDISFAQIGLGVALVVVQERSKADLLRFVVFAWVLFAVGVILVAAVAQGVFLPLLPILLFSGGIIGLMLERLNQSQVIVYTAVALAGMAISLLI